MGVVRCNYRHNPKRQRECRLDLDKNQARTFRFEVVGLGVVLEGELVGGGVVSGGGVVVWDTVLGLHC